MRQRWAAAVRRRGARHRNPGHHRGAGGGGEHRDVPGGRAGVGELAAGGGKVYLAALDRVVVADATGAVTGAITGLTGAMGLALSADGGRLYVALSDTAEVAEVDTGTLRITRRVGLGSHACPSQLTLAGDRLWVGYGCYGQWGGGVDTFDVSAASPTVTGVGGPYYGAPLVAATGGVLAVGTPGLSPATIEVYSVDGAATLRGAITGSVSDVKDLAITPDGATPVAAFGPPTGTSPTTPATWPSCAATATRIPSGATRTTSRSAPAGCTSPPAGTAAWS